MARWNQFFIFCSGIDPEILDQCPTDRNKYIGISATVFFTGLLALFSGGYALYTVFESWAIALLFGLVWGLMIFNLDRYIVSSMKRRGSVFKDISVAFPRLVFAVLLAIVIAKPLELKIFEKEINAELVEMEQEIFKEWEALILERFQPRQKIYTAEIIQLKKEIALKTENRNDLARMALVEADGTGGSMQRNMGSIYRIKKEDADQAQVELEEIIAMNEPVIARLENQIADLDKQMNEEIASYEQASIGDWLREWKRFPG